MPSTYTETPTGGGLGAGLALNTERYNSHVPTGGVETLGLVQLAEDDFLTPPRCTGQTSTSMCCTRSGDKISVTWLKVRDAYVSAITVCNLSL